MALSRRLIKKSHEHLKKMQEVGLRVCFNLVTLRISAKRITATGKWMIISKYSRKKKNYAQWDIEDRIPSVPSRTHVPRRNFQLRLYFNVLRSLSLSCLKNLHDLLFVQNTLYYAN